MSRRNNTVSTVFAILQILYNERREWKSAYKAWLGSRSKKNGNYRPVAPSGCPTVILRALRRPAPGCTG